MENCEIKIEDIRKGDHILVGSNGNLQYVIVLKDPKLAKRKNNSGVKSYSRLLCSRNIQEISKYWVDSLGRQRHYTVKQAALTEKDHNQQFYINLNDRPAWLVKRPNQEIL